MTFDPSAQPGAFDDRKPISADEVLKLRARVWSDGSVSASEADNLFELNRSAAPSPEWLTFFIEAICEFLLSNEGPRGYVSDAGANWLIAHVDRDGRIGSHAELELLVKLLERANYAPEPLRKFALHEIEQTVLGAGRVDDVDVALIRRLIFAPAGDSPAKVSKAEAEMLFRLKDATLGAENSGEWKKLFIQGIANHLMAHQDYVPPSASEEMRLEQPYKADPLNHVLSRLGHGLASAQEFEASLFRNEHDKAADFQQQVAADAAVSTAESDWLKRLFEQDGARDELEQALVDALAEDGIRCL
jgi:hypothetical protein